MTTRRPDAFMASRSLTVSGRASAFMGVEFGQLSEPEVAVGQLGMRNDKVVLGQLLVAEPNDVEIERASAPALGAEATLLALDCLEGGQQCTWLQRSLQHHHLIEIGWLVHAGQWGGLCNRRLGDQRGLRK